jgi:uncharacterized ParB-like nuclease family protein
MDTNSYRHAAALQGSVYYAVAGDRKLFHYADTPPQGTEETNTEFVEHVVEIRDVRQSSKPLRLEVEGAAIVNHRSAVRSFYDPSELRRVGYPETAALVRAVTGAADVLVFDHNIRRGGDLADAQARSWVKRPVFHIHTDFTGRSAQVRAAAVCGTTQITGQRIAAINVWRPIAAPVRDCPLTICDASSVEQRDLLPADLLYQDRTGEIYYVAFNPAHRWFYASDMRSDEVWMFKNYDSSTDGRSRFTPHTAFVDPTNHFAIAARESVEFRAFALFND